MRRRGGEKIVCRRRVTQGHSPTATATPDVRRVVSGVRTPRTKCNRSEEFVAIRLTDPLVHRVRAVSRRLRVGRANPSQRPSSPSGSTSSTGPIRIPGLPGIVVGSTVLSCFSLSGSAFVR